MLGNNVSFTFDELGLRAPLNFIAKSVFHFHDYLLLNCLVIMSLVTVFLIRILCNINLSTKKNPLYVYQIIKDRIYHIIQN